MKSFPLNEKPNRYDLAIYDEAVSEWKKNPRLKRPYVLLGKLDKNFRSIDGTSYKAEWVASVFEMVAGLINSCEDDLMNYIRKGCVVLDHWIPTVAELPPMETREGFPMDHGWAAEMRGIEGQKRAETLRNAIARLKGETKNIVRLNTENAAMKAKLDSYEAKMRESKKNG